MVYAFKGYWFYISSLCFFIKNIWLIKKIFLSLQKRNRKTTTKNNNLMTSVSRLEELIKAFGIYNGGRKTIPSQISINGVQFFAPSYIIESSIICCYNVQYKAVNITEEIATEFLTQIITKSFIHRCFESLVHKRFSILSLENLLSSLFNCEVELNDFNTDADLDYRLIYNHPLIVDLDIWYLKMQNPGPHGEYMYITEVNVEVYNN